MTPPFVKRYLIALDRHKWAGLAGFALIMGASVLVAAQPEEPPTYVAQGTLANNRPPVTFSETGTQIQAEGQVLSPEILLADNVVEAAAKQVDAEPDEVRRNATVEEPKKEKGKNDNAGAGSFIITYRDGNDPKRAAETAKVLMDGMVEQSRLINTARLRAIIQELNQRLPQATKDLRTAEQQLEQYDRREGPALVAAQNGNVITAIQNAEEQQRQLRLAMEGTMAQMRSLQQRLGLNPEQAYASSALSADPIIANLRSQLYQNESQIALLSQSLRPEHPTMIELRNQQQAYETLLQQRAGEVVGGNQVAAPLVGGNQIRRDSSLDPARQQLANQLTNLQTQLDTMRQQMASAARTEQEMRREYAVLPNKQLERTRLEQQTILKRTFYDRMQAALVDAKAAEAETASSLTIAKAPEVSQDAKPAKNAPLTLGIGALVGLIVGGGLILLLDSLEGKFYTLEDVREALRQREIAILGVLPLLPNLDPYSDDIPVVVDPESPYADFYERLRSNLRRAEGKTLKVILVTSVVGQEGKTLSAYNLAIASARAGRRTLLVEADLRSPSQAKSLKVAPDPDSAIEPLRYYGQFGDCIRLVPDVENLYIVPSPGPQRQAAAILESSEIRRLLEDVRGRFDMVILDTPSLSLCNDALLLEPYSDGMLLVTRPGYTEDSLLAEATDQLAESDFRLLGAIINGVDIPVQSVEPLLDEELTAHALGEDMAEDLGEVATSTRDYR
ncbi:MULTISPECIES: tyrosine-protein kinase domain-containing protein [Trichocoleus]|uniref:Polysaccharide biosynthesis tyrosine autokinase n=1 Tax=Trichocoleus desertorum GB2-A4 TaxID=2933944 RepID=A0ABV0J446_9CYAN|nr:MULTISPECIES: tyrosine-protein kinase domain-containing protein [unclassified Trichocoleus]MBD1861771.1 polysaccharide biosynthesis tyrosine autokinase [Trichocoleus sp. FACHB-46]MBD2098237.1 polysaccharide biosynthesis tyrosine autokinase [Trichocoleus sp. FACHB-591]